MDEDEQPRRPYPPDPLAVDRLSPLLASDVDRQPGEPLRIYRGPMRLLEPEAIDGLEGEAVLEAQTTAPHLHPHL